jgi:hypothetical protein
VTITFDGQFAATVTVTLDGSFTITTAVTDPHVSVDGGSLDVAAFGSNAVTASGTGANNQALTVTDTEIIPAVATSTVTGGSTGATGSSGTGSSGTSSSSSGSSLAFTGAQIGMMAGGGLLLLVAGTGIVLATRQRRSRTI